MSTNKKEEIIQNIMTQLEDVDVAWYLKSEVKDLLKYLHYYKIKNVYQNIDALKEYLELLDRQSSNQIHTLVYEKMKQSEIPQGGTDHDLHYYISQKWLIQVGEHKMYQKIWENDYNLNYIMQGIKWFLLLTADEFCNATPTRMSINRLLWQKELNSKAK